MWPRGGLGRGPPSTTTLRHATPPPTMAVTVAKTTTPTQTTTSLGLGWLLAAPQLRGRRGRGRMCRRFLFRVFRAGPGSQSQSQSRRPRRSRRRVLPRRPRRRPSRSSLWLGMFHHSSNPSRRHGRLSIGALFSYVIRGAGEARWARTDPAQAKAKARARRGQRGCELLRPLAKCKSMLGVGNYSATLSALGPRTA